LASLGKECSNLETTSYEFITIDLAILKISSCKIIVFKAALEVYELACLVLPCLAGLDRLVYLH
jgi:hypothetical protein